MATLTISEDLKLEDKIHRIQLTSEERAQLSRGADPFSLAAWQEEAPPAQAEELAEMEDFLRQRERDREFSLAGDAGLLP